MDSIHKVMSQARLSTEVVGITETITQIRSEQQCNCIFTADMLVGHLPTPHSLLAFAYLHHHILKTC
jgi:hypothetical protein